MLCCFHSSPFYILELFLQIKVLSMHNKEKYELFSHSFSHFKFEEFPCLGMTVREEGVVRVVLEAPPLVVAWVKVQPRLLPSTVTRFFYFFIFLFFYFFFAILYHPLVWVGRLLVSAHSILSFDPTLFCLFTYFALCTARCSISTSFPYFVQRFC